jgi:asparagine synthetase B (glutamine-hydrolysing)
MSYELAPLEVATGLVLGVEPKLELVDGRRVDATAPPLRAFERAVLPALRRPPCLVSFSGGRDSSAVLAVVTEAARRESLPLPIPATNVFPGVASTDESEWQEQVVSNLGLDDWVRLEHDEALDCVGPVAADVLRRHGLVFPFNAHFHMPLLRLAAGGSLLTGIGGDEALSPSSWSRAADVLQRRVRPQPRDILRIGFALAPELVRRRILRRRQLGPSYPWLQPEARRAFTSAWVAQAATEPLGWAAHIDWVRRLRYLRVGLGSLRLLASDCDVEISHPFLDRGFANALAALAPRERLSSRTAAMHALFGELLPKEILERSSKTGFDEVFWGRPSRAFAACWNGKGVDEQLVDAEALAVEWASPEPDPRSFLLAQAVWLGQEQRSSNGVEQAVHSIRQ